MLVRCGRGQRKGGRLVHGVREGGVRRDFCVINGVALSAARDDVRSSVCWDAGTATLGGLESFDVVRKRHRLCLVGNSYSSAVWSIYYCIRLVPCGTTPRHV